MHSHSDCWRLVRQIENLKASVVSALDHANCTRTHITHQTGNYGRMLIEIEQTRQELYRIMAALDADWETLYHVAIYNGLPRVTESVNESEEDHD